MADLEVHITEGQWRVVSGNHGTSKVYIEHFCFESYAYNDIWVPMRFQYYQFSSACGWCAQPVPEGIQAVWVMLTDDSMTTSEGQRHQYP